MAFRSGLSTLAELTARDTSPDEAKESAKPHRGNLCPTALNDLFKEIRRGRRFEHRYRLAEMIIHANGLRFGAIDVYLLSNLRDLKAGLIGYRADKH